MRIISLEPYITELLDNLGLTEDIVGIAHNERNVELLKKCRIVSSEGAADSLLAYYIMGKGLLIDAIKDLKPDIIIASLYAKNPEETISQVESKELQQKIINILGFEIKLLSYAPRLLDEIYEESKILAKALNQPFRGDDLALRVKAQLMDWGDNFYDRMKNKKVSFICSLQPLMLAGRWVPEMISALSALSQVKSPVYENVATDWNSILEFKPDVIVVAPEKYSLKESMATFKLLEKMPSWQEIPAVKRGEVVFCDGLDHFYEPGPKILSSFGILVSAIAGFESGYITKRDSFYRLRWLELQRHRF
jgi:iron complex transport system substrate-binding protein